MSQDTKMPQSDCGICYVVGKSAFEIYDGYLPRSYPVASLGQPFNELLYEVLVTYEIVHDYARGNTYKPRKTSEVLLEGFL